MLEKNLRRFIPQDFDPESMKKSSGTSFHIAGNDQELKEKLPEDSEELLIITGMDILKGMLDELNLYHKAKIIKTERPTYQRVKLISEWIDDNSIQKIMGFGGGTVIDVAKRASFESRLGENIGGGEVNPNYVAVPTVGSHDGPFSSGSSLYDNDIDMDSQEIKSIRKSEPANAAGKVVLPLHYWRRAPKDLRLGGIMDVLANIMALQDVSLSESREKFISEGFEEYKAASAHSVLLLNKYLKNKDFKSLAESILFSGLAMRSEKGSVFASGFEHELERFIRDICEIEERHGKVVGFSSLLSSKLYQENSEKLSNLDLLFDPVEIYPKVLKDIKRIIGEDRDFFDDLFFELRRVDSSLKEIENLRKRYTLRCEIDLGSVDLERLLTEIEKDLKP